MSPGQVTLLQSTPVILPPLENPVVHVHLPCEQVPWPLQALRHGMVAGTDAVLRGVEVTVGVTFCIVIPWLPAAVTSFFPNPVAPASCTLAFRLCVKSDTVRPEGGVTSKVTLVDPDLREEEEEEREYDKIVTPVAATPATSPTVILKANCKLAFANCVGLIPDRDMIVLNIRLVLKFPLANKTSPRMCVAWQM
jgi:hypothetical protein